MQRFVTVEVKCVCCYYFVNVLWATFGNCVFMRVRLLKLPGWFSGWVCWDSVFQFKTSFFVIFLLICYNCLPEILKLWSDKLLWCFLPVFANSAALELFIRSTEKPQLRTVNGNVWTSDAHSIAQVKAVKSASISVINFKAFRNHGSSAKRGEISQAIIWSSSVWWSTSLGLAGAHEAG